jgi:murein DD-endopeptidase MepM/ murein hydrolase activator NlpD
MLKLLRLSPFLLLTLMSAACTTRADSGPNHPQSTEPDKPATIISSPCDGFDFPVGPPDGKSYYNAQGFGKNLHLGDDWNGRGGGNTDLGDPVYSVADGIVVFAEDVLAGWGNVVRVVHNIGRKDSADLVESLYGHLDSIYVRSGDTLKRGEQLGTIGNAHGAYWAHLHLEIRDSVGMPIGGGYAEEISGFLDPTVFIRAHRPNKP